jgi:hypothetical protein
MSSAILQFIETERVRGFRLPAAASSLENENSPTTFVRRPMRGIVIPKDSHASIEIVTPGGDAPTNLRLRNSSAVVGLPVTYTTNFIIQSFTESRSEKHQFISTFGATYAFFFGEQPRQVSVTAVVPNTADFEWHREWWLNYEERLRGTTLASSNTRAKLRVADGRSTLVIYGYLLNCTSSVSAQDPYMTQISFSMFVEDVVRPHVDATSPALLNTGPSPVDVTNLAGNSPYESTTAAVRRANIKLSPFAEPTAVGKFFGALNSIDAALDNFVRSARNLLYGRNLVVPVSYTSPRLRGSIFAAGSAQEDLNNLAVSNLFGVPTLIFSNNPGSSPVRTVDLRTNVAGDLSLEENYRKRVKTPPLYYQNTDEYLSYPGEGAETQIQYLQESEKARNAKVKGEAVFYQSQSVAAFAAFGIDIPALSAVPGLSSRAELESAGRTAIAAQARNEKIANVLRILSRAAFGAVIFAIGNSIVNRRRELQNNITNPNTGNLERQTQLSLQADISRETLSTEQRRLEASRRAARLRGDTGTISPGSFGSILSVIL